MVISPHLAHVGFFILIMANNYINYEPLSEEDIVRLYVKVEAMEQLISSLIDFIGKIDEVDLSKSKTSELSEMWKDYKQDIS